MYRWATMVVFVVAFFIFVGATCSKAVDKGKKIEDGGAIEDASSEDLIVHEDVKVFIDSANAVVEDDQ